MITARDHGRDQGYDHVIAGNYGRGRVSNARGRVYIMHAAAPFLVVSSVYEKILSCKVVNKESPDVGPAP